MRKIFATFMLLVVFSLTIFADGVTPIGGGRSCPPEEPNCTLPVNDPNQTSGTNSDETNTENQDDTESGTIEEFLDYLKSLIG